MKNSLLLRSLQQLSGKERRAFSEYVACSLFNRRPEVGRLNEYLLTNLDKPSPKILEAERLYEATFPGTTYDNGALRHVMSYLLELLRQFLAWMEWRADDAAQEQAMIRALRNRGMDKLFEQSLGKVETRNLRAPLRDARHHFNQYRLHHEKLEREARHERSARLNLQPLPDELTAFYVAEMLRHACSSLMHQAVSGQHYQMQLLDAILDVAAHAELLQSPAVAVYYQAYRMLQSPEDGAPFEALKKLLLEHEHRFEPEEMRGLYLMAINGCIRRMNAGKRAYIREAFEVYRAALERNFLTENGFLSSFTYKNIIRIGAALGENEWTENFIETQQASLHPRERDNTYLYNRAFLFFQKGDFTRAMPLLQQVEFDDPLNYLHARRMLVRSYYELGELDALESLLQSFITYLQRRKNLGYHLELNLHFARFTQRLLKIPAGDTSAKTTLRKEIEAAVHLAEREWLLEKLGHQTQ